MPEAPYVPRLLDGRIQSLFASLPALLVTGPRATGKTTLAARHAATVVRLDNEAEAVAFRADPDATLRGLPEPVLLDEWQAVPSVLGAVKRAVDRSPQPSRFLLTGSVRADLQGETWPGTGRIVRLRLFGITMRELVGVSPARDLFIDRLARLADGGLDLFPLPSTVPDLRGYVDICLRSGFPEPLLRLDDEARAAWLEGYVDQLLTRDARELLAVRDPARLRRYFEALAISTAGLPKHETLYTAAGINYRTASAYDDLLVNLHVLDVMPAWSTNRLSRLMHAGKRYLVDPALIAPAARVDAAGILRDGDLLGRMLDTFVASQLRPETEVSPARPRLYHVREEHGRYEIDIIGDLGTGIVGVEVKATAAPSHGDAAHLARVRDAFGTQFLGGAVLHTGPRAFMMSDRIAALPICSIWG
ncbi:MAG TPA: DUF4143 domain-containing protein [Chloroflexota bacterium]|nr:DUF4143 domain-containing protein [Chloroflexota bacterium]